MLQKKRKNSEIEGKKVEDTYPINKDSKKQRYEDDRKSQLLRLSESLSLSSVQSQLVGRTQERNSITSFLDQHIKEHKPGGMYVSGSPGTGKTALLLEILGSRQDIRTIYINCMELSNRNAIFDSIAKKLHIQASKKPVDAIKVFLCKKHSRMIVIVLDEIDQLLSKDKKSQTVLYDIFQWTSEPSSNLILFGIANIKTMTEQHLPMLETMECAPKRLDFECYKANEIELILKDRIQSAKVDESLFEPSALNYVARSISKNFGDVRKALDVCRKAVEQLENGLKNSETTTIPKVTLGIVSDIISSNYGFKPINEGIVTAVPLEKILLLASLKLLRTKKKPTIHMLRQSFIATCKEAKMDASANVAKDSQFVSLVENAVCQGLINMQTTKKKGGSEGLFDQRTFSLQVSEEDIVSNFKDLPILKNLLP